MRRRICSIQLSLYLQHDFNLFCRKRRRCQPRSHKSDKFDETWKFPREDQNPKSAKPYLNSLSTYEVVKPKAIPRVFIVCRRIWETALSGNRAHIMHVRIYWTRIGEVQWKFNENYNLIIISNIQNDILK